MLLAGFLFLSATISAQPKLQSNNTDAIIKAMTLEEKAALLVGFLQDNAYFGLPSAASQNTNELVSGAAGQTTPIARLGIPRTVLSDGPAGVRIQPKRKGDSHTYYCTGFPVGTCLASSWNTDLVHHVGAAIGNEVLEYGIDVLLAPGMNIHRNPLCGRNFEYFSEDPVLAGKISAAYVKGVQSNGVGVSVKHFAANNQESNRIGDDAVISQRALREIYLKGFEIAVREANPWTIMSSYNRLNGPFTQENRDLLTTILRDEWGFKGIVMTDWTDTRNTKAQVHAGNDLMMPGRKAQIDEIISKVKGGELAESDVNLCAKRILEYIVQTPHFKGYKFSNQPDLKAHALVTRKSATEGMVLLKNEGQTLPMASVKKVALFGVTSYSFIAGGGGSGDVNKAYVVDLKDGLTNAGYELNPKLTDLYTKYATFGVAARNVELGKLADLDFYCKPCITEPDLSDKLYKKMAAQEDIAVITIGRISGEGADRVVDGDFNLTEQEQNVIKRTCDAFHAVNKKVIVILNIGGVIETASWKAQPDAILLVWQPGQEGGNSVADVLKGTAYPSGKLPMTFPVHFADHPSSANFPTNYSFENDWTMKQAEKDVMPNVGTTLYNEGIYVGYRYFESANKAVSYPFGYGLSYTAFDYLKAKISGSGKNFTATVTVKNTGSTVGKEVIELYVTAPKGTLEKPFCELKAFAKTKELQPGEMQTLKLSFSNYDLASYDEAQQAWVTDAGTYQAKFGTSVDEIKLTVPFKVSKNKVACHNVMAPDKQLDKLTLK